MRFIKKTIYLFIIIGTLFSIYRFTYPALVKWLTLPVPQTAKFTTPNIAISYSLHKDNWLTFNIDRKLDFVKITTNAEFLNSPGVNLNYAINYEILDENNKVLYKNTYYLKSQKKIFRKKYSKRVLSNPYMIQGHYFLSPSQSFIIPLKDFNKKLDKIRFKRRILNDSKVKGVLLRVSIPKNLAPGKSSVLWLRLSDNKRKELAQSNFYPEQMLNNQEKNNLINNLTTYAGPTNKKVGRIRIAHVPHDMLHSKPLAEITITNENKKYNSELYTLYRNSSGGNYTVIKISEIAKAEQLFNKMFSGCSLREVKNDWNKLGMDIKEIKRGKRTYLVVYEQANKKYGRGFYIFCRSKIMRNIVLQMPHRYFDKGTGLIGYKLMLTGYYTAGAWNTVFRYQTPNYITYTSDMAHNIAHSYYSAFTRAFCKTMPEQSILIQLHGYDSTKSKNSKIQKSKIVISEATNSPTSKFLFYAKRLKARMPKPTYIYPAVKDIDELGALNNAAAFIIKSNGSKKHIFIHFEMNHDIRKDMINDYSLRNEFTTAVKYKMKHIYKNNKLE
jgi:hypothetical protein